MTMVYARVGVERVVCLHAIIILLRARLGSAQLGESLGGAAEHIEFRDGIAAGEEGRRTAGEVRITAAGCWFELFAGGGKIEELE